MLQAQRKYMQVKDIMTSKVESVTPATPIAEVAELLRKHGFSGVPVVDKDNKVLGLISGKELFAVDFKVHIPTYLYLLKETKFVVGSGKELPFVEQQVLGLKAKDVLNQDVYFATPEMELEQLVEIFTLRKQDPVLVADKDKHLLGIVSRSDLIKLLEPKFPLKFSPSVPRKRPIDKELEYVRKDLSSHFAYVSRARANIWVTVAITLMIVGFIAGIIYTADPNIIKRKTIETDFNDFNN